MTKRGMVIIGAGEAGARAAEQLRTAGWDGPVFLIGSEARPPYERPPLSKSALTDEGEPAPATIHSDEKLAQLDIKLIAGVRAERIDRQSHTVHLSDGSEAAYERLLLTLGAQPRRLPFAPADTGELLYLRTFEDALALRSRLRPGSRVVVIGAGFIGLEVAASARTIGCDVTVVEVGPRILMRGVPIEVAGAVEQRHRQAGVAFKLGTGIERISKRQDGHEIALADGTIVACDAIVVGIGAVPVTDLAADCGLAIDNGIAADARLATGDPDIFAAGDCCSFVHNIFGGRRLRLEAWRNAQDQGVHAAGSMLGADRPYTAVPWFWSDQYELMLQVAGLPDAGNRTVRREVSGGHPLFFHLAEDGRLVGASGIGSPSLSKDIRIAEMLIERGASPTPEALADPGVRLKSLL